MLALLPLDLLIHACGMVALLFNIKGLVRPCDRTLRQTTGLAAVLWAVNNLLLGAHTAAALSAVTVGRQISAEAVQQATAQRRRLACAGFMALMLAIAVFTWHGPITLFTTGGSMLATYAMFYMQGIRLRLAMVAVSLLWMANAVAFDSWEQAAANVASGAAAAWGAWRIQRAAAAASPARG